MKRKFKGIVSIGVLLIMVLIIAAYYYSGFWRRAGTPTEPVRAPKVSEWMPSDDQVRTIQRLTGKLNVLARPSTRSTDSSPLILFGQQAAPIWNHGDGRNAEGSASLSNRLTMTLLAGPIRCCIVNGDFVSEGARLKNGATIVKIETQRVLIARDNQTAWLYLESDALATDRKNAPGPLPGKGSS